MNKETTVKIIRWMTRIWGGLVILFLAVMFLGDLFVPGEKVWPTTKELIGFLFVPIGLVVGLALAYRYELIGGLVTILSFVVFCLYQRLFNVNDYPFYANLIFLAMVFPGVIYFILGLFLGRKR